MKSNHEQSIQHSMRDFLFRHTGVYAILAAISFLICGCGDCTESIAHHRGDASCVGVHPGRGVAWPRIAWKFCQDGEVSTAPIMKDGRIYFGSRNGNLYAVCQRTGREMWVFGASDEVFAPAAIGPQGIYFGDDAGVLYALDSRTGLEQWRFIAGGGIGAAPLVLGDTVYCVSTNGVLHALDARSGRVVWSYEALAESFCAPSYGDGTLLFGDAAGRLHAIDARTGRMIWIFETIDEIFSPPVVSDGVAYLGSYDGCIYAIEVVTGREIWQFPVDIPLVRCLAFSNDIVYAVAGAKAMAIEAAGGRYKWSVEVEAMACLDPVISGEYLYFNSFDGFIYSVDTATGCVVWEKKAGGSSPLSICCGTIYLAGWDGCMYALE